MNRFACFFITMIAVLAGLPATAQPTAMVAERIRKQHHIPELAYAVVSADSVLELKVMGIKKSGTTLLAAPEDRFRIGSNTKTVTGFLAALLVEQHKIAWNTRFFDLFPELRSKSHPAYHKLTLLNLLSFRTRLFPYTYTYPTPTKDQFSGDDAEQRYRFAAWFFQQEPVGNTDSIHFSNLGYVAAGMMLEKASGKSYTQLVSDLGEVLGIRFGFGRPNTGNPAGVWGHDGLGKPEGGGDDYKLNWLQAAGNINVSLPDYTRFIQMQLKGLAGRSELLPRQTFRFLHFGLPGFSVGWFWGTDTRKRVYSYHTGNPGTFLSKVWVFPAANRAYIIFANIQSDEAESGMNALYALLQKKYGN